MTDSIRDSVLAKRLVEARVDLKEADYERQRTEQAHREASNAVARALPDQVEMGVEELMSAREDYGRAYLEMVLARLKQEDAMKRFKRWLCEGEVDGSE